MINVNASPDIIYTTANDVRNICNSIMQGEDIQFFDFARLFDDGSYYILSTHANVMEYLYQNQSPLFAPIPDKFLCDQFVYYIPEDGPYQKVMHDVRSNFNIAHGFDMFEVGPGYVDVCCFAASADNREIINYYFNNREAMRNTIDEFKQQADALIRKVSDARLILPKPMRLNFTSASISSKKMGSLLSYRQKQCLSRLLEGKTMKDIGKELNLSHRTVGHYLEAAKDKLGCNSRADLFSKAKKYLTQN